MASPQAKRQAVEGLRQVHAELQDPAQLGSYHPTAHATSGFALRNVLFVEVVSIAISKGAKAPTTPMTFITYRPVHKTFGL